MEFLIAAAILIIGGYFGYEYYLAKKAAPSHFDLPESVEVKVEPVVSVAETAKVTTVTTEKKEAKKKSTSAKPAAAKQATKTATEKKKAPAKKKPNMKIVK